MQTVLLLLNSRKFWVNIFFPNFVKKEKQIKQNKSFPENNLIIKTNAFVNIQASVAFAKVHKNILLKKQLIIFRCT